MVGGKFTSSLTIFSQNTNTVQSVIVAALIGSALLLVAPRVVDDGHESFGTGRTSREPTLLIVGDIMLGRAVEKHMDTHGQSYPFASSSTLLKSADLVVANFEGTIPATHVPTPISSFRFSFRPETAHTLAEQGIRLVTLGNNHALDFGEDEYEHTRLILRAAGVESVGHPSRVDDSIAYFILQGRPYTLVSLNDTWGTLESATATDIVREATHMGAYGKPFVLVSIHWGDEYALQANDRQRQLASALSEAGANLIVGHHPHVVQNIERIGETLVLYSLGNFIFDQYFSAETQEGLGALLTADEVGYGLDLIPFESERSRPRPLTDTERADYLQVLAGRSSPDLHDEIISGTIRISGNDLD